MAKIPTYQSGASLSPQMPVVPSTGEIMQEAGKALGDLADHFQELKNQQESNSAHLDLDKKLQGIHFQALDMAKKAQTASQIDAAGTWASDEITKSITESSGRISSESAREKYISQANFKGDRANMTLGTYLMQQQVDLGKSTALDRGDSIIDQYYSASNPQDKARLKDEFIDNANQAIKAGYFHREQGYTYIKTHLDKMAIGQAEHDLEIYKQDPQLVENFRTELNKGKDGKYADLTGTQRTEMLGKVDSAMKYANTLQKEKERYINHITDKDLTWKYINGTLTKDEVLKNYDKMTPERAKTLIKGIENSTYGTNPHANEYHEMMDYISDTKNSERDCINKLLDYETSGKLTKKETQSLTHLFYLPTEKDPVFQVREANLQNMLRAQEEKNGAHKGIGEKLGAFWKSLFGNKDTKAELMQRISDAKQKSIIPNEDLTSIAEKEKQKYISERRPDLNSIPEGKVKKTSDGFYGVKTANGWRDATPEEVSRYNQEHGLEEQPEGKGEKYMKGAK